MTGVCPSHTRIHAGCTIIDPIVGRLVEGSIETFRVRVPNATTVSVAANDGFRNILSRQYLKRCNDADDTFIGQVCIPSNSCIVLATFGSKDDDTKVSLDDYEDSLDASGTGGEDVPILLHSYAVIQSRDSAMTRQHDEVELADSFDVSSI